jgi:hypothetical protein
MPFRLGQDAPRHVRSAPARLRVRTIFLGAARVRDQRQLRTRGRDLVLDQFLYWQQPACQLLCKGPSKQVVVN